MVPETRRGAPRRRNAPSRLAPGGQPRELAASGVAVPCRSPATPRLGYDRLSWLRTCQKRAGQVLGSGNKAPGSDMPMT
jgi:hypothetical protein